MVQITLKAKHYYYIVYQLRNTQITQYFSLINRIKTSLTGNTDLEALFTISSNPWEVTSIFRTVTILPEGQANRLNVEMDDLLAPQIQAGVIAEINDGIEPDADGNLPNNAYWQIIARDITNIKTSNTTARDTCINEGKRLIDQI